MRVIALLLCLALCGCGVRVTVEVWPRLDLDGDSQVQNVYDLSVAMMAEQAAREMAEREGEDENVNVR